MNLQFLKNKVFFYYEVVFTLQLCVPSVDNIRFFTCNLNSFKLIWLCRLIHKIYKNMFSLNYKTLCYFS